MAADSQRGYTHTEFCADLFGKSRILLCAARFCKSLETVEKKRGVNVFHTNHATELRAPGYVLPAWFVFRKQVGVTITLLTAALVVITAFYAWVTFKIMSANQAVVSAMQQQAEAESRPYVTVNVFCVPKGELFYLRIANTGRTVANDLFLTLDRDFYQYGQKDHPSLKLATAFQQRIEQFPPGSEMVFGLAQGWVVLGKDADPALTPSVFAIEAEYSFGSKTVTEKTTIDLRPYGVTMDPPSGVVDELARIRKELEKVVKKLGA